VDYPQQLKHEQKHVRKEYNLIILVVYLYIVVVVDPGDKWINAGLGKRPEKIQRFSRAVWGKID
jgi:hypothetical protein